MNSLLALKQVQSPRQEKMAIQMFQSMMTCCPASKHCMSCVIHQYFQLASPILQTKDICSHTVLTSKVCAFEISRYNKFSFVIQEDIKTYNP